ncbi:uncharacterized protein RCO7_07630 [Rhynchosporium graminicola]|uniref:Uncharacterized protein n=1 Tax=Rhynchosporium graminicola TaxID=2792576 RepID=A0A1E1KZH9_9HELO|nr:uncharacterized protein RCO7_07630 [Rhynchosporium commune]
MSSDIEEIREKHKRMDYARMEISTKRISGKPNQSQGREFMKHGIWLAAALAGTGWDKESIDGAVEQLVQSIEKHGGKVIGLVDSVMRTLGE